MKNKEVKIFGTVGPPSSPPIAFDLLKRSTTMTKQASVQKSVTEYAKLKELKFALTSF